jgi:hypothetical protein
MGYKAAEITFSINEIRNRWNELTGSIIIQSTVDYVAILIKDGCVHIEHV